MYSACWIVALKRRRRRRTTPKEIFAALAAAESLRCPRRRRSLRRVCRRRWLLAAQPAIAGRGALAVSNRLTPSWLSYRTTTSFAAAPALDLAGLRPLMTGRGPGLLDVVMAPTRCRARTGRAVAGRKFKHEARTKSHFNRTPVGFFAKRFRTNVLGRTAGDKTLPAHQLTARWNNSKCSSSRFVRYVNRIDQ
jgi:hypothetical protein